MIAPNESQIDIEVGLTGIKVSGKSVNWQVVSLVGFVLLGACLLLRGCGGVSGQLQPQASKHHADANLGKLGFARDDR